MENKNITMIRYISILCFVASMVMFRKDNIDFYSIFFVLIFLLNNQIRYFILKRKDWLMLGSIGIELLLLYKMFGTYGGVLFFCYFPTAFDCAFLIGSRLSYVGLAMTLATVAMDWETVPRGQWFSAIAAYGILFYLAHHIKNEYDRKIEAQGLYDKLRVSEEKLIKANHDLENYANSIEELTLLRERNRISREIHDSVGHSISTMIIQLGAIEKIAHTSSEEASAMAKSLGEFAKDSLQEVRTAVRELKPDEFEEHEGLLSIQELIRKFVKFTGVDIKFTFSKERWGLSQEKSLVAYRAVQEFLSNAVRHGKATRIDINMNFMKDSLILTMQDNGAGAETVVEGVGLKSIKERTREIGGSMNYTSVIGKGFFMKIVLSKAEKMFISKEEINE